MKIAGLQKVSTIDFPGEICCVVFLWGCNFRCGFCYNPELVIRESGEGISQEYVFDFLSRRMGKLDGVCITGGEPLLSLDLDFVRRIKSMGFKIKIDTNGSNPLRLQELIDEELIDYIAMDIKGPREDYEKITGVDVDLEKIEKSIKIVNDFNRDVGTSGRLGVGEFRTTVVLGLHTIESLKSMGEWVGSVCLGKPDKIFLQGFKPNKEGMIDPSFIEKGEVLEGYLLRVKEELVDLFGEVGIRV